MNKLFFFVLLLACSLFSQSGSVLFLHPNGPRYKKVEMGIKSELHESVRIVSLISKNEMEIKSVIDNNSPRIVIVSSIDMIKIWKKLQSKYSEMNQISSILLESESPENDIGEFSNYCVVNSDTKLSQYIELVNQLTGRKPQSIGVIYSSKSVNVTQAYKKEGIKLNVNVYDKQVIASDPEASIKSSVENLTDLFNVEFIVILDDPVTINNQNIQSTWVSLLSRLKIPVAVPADYFYEIEPKIGSLAIQPHYSAIGGVIASIINRAVSNNWYVEQKYVYTDKSIFYYRNKDGSISKQNYVQNEIIALYHPKNEAVSIRPEPSIDKQREGSPNDIVITTEKQRNATSNNIVTVINEKPSFDNNDVVNESGIPPPKNIQPKSVVTIERIDEDNGQEEKPQIVKKEVKQSASVAGTAYNEITDDVFSPSNSSPDPGSASNQTLQHDSESMQLPPQKASDSFHSRHLSSLLIVLFLFIVAIVVYVSLKKRKDKFKYKCLLIANTRKLILYSDLTNKSITLSGYLKKCGFKIFVSKSVNEINDHLLFNIPEIICIDWELEVDVQMKFYKILKEQMFYSDFILIFYNVPVSAKTNIGYYEDRTFYLNSDFTVSDFKKVIYIIQKRAQVQKQSDNQVNPQLEGKIVGDSLSEIFQLMDINKKTGCLIVETDHPAGTVFFEEGFITYAISNTQIAEQAVFDILAMESGSFHFIPDKKPISRNMQASVVALLMEQAQSTDESSEFELIK